MFNSIDIVGRLTKDPEQQLSKNGIAFTKFSIAHVKEFSKKEKTDFFEVVAWRSTAMFICNYFKKGQLILISGKLVANPWEDENGKHHNDTQIEADTAYFFGVQPAVTSGLKEATGVTDDKPDEIIPNKINDEYFPTAQESSRFNRAALSRTYEFENKEKTNE